jgi:hypothetical protein
MQKVSAALHLRKSQTMSDARKTSDERKRAKEPDAEPAAKRAHVPPQPPAAAVKSEPAADDMAAGDTSVEIALEPRTLGTLGTLCRSVQPEYAQEGKAPNFRVLAMFHGPVRQDSEKSSSSIKWTVLDVEPSEYNAAGITPGFTSAPYEVPGPALYFDKSKRLDPQYTKTVLNQVQYNVHGYKCVGRYHTFERHPTKAQENRGRGLGSQLPAGALLPGVEMRCRIFSDSPQDVLPSESEQKLIQPFSVGIIELGAKSTDKAENGYGLKVKRVKVCKSAPKWWLFDNAGTYYTHTEPVQRQTERLLESKRFENASGAKDLAGIENMLAGHSQYASPLVLVDSRERQTDGQRTLFSIMISADAVTMQLTLNDPASIYHGKVLHVHMPRHAFDGSLDVRWVCSLYAHCLQAAKALVVVMHNEEAAKPGAGSNMSCIVLVRENELFHPVAPVASSTRLPLQLLNDLADETLAKEQERDAIKITPGAEGAGCGFMVWALPNNVYCVLTRNERSKTATDSGSTVAPMELGESPICPLQHIVEMPSGKFYVLILCVFDGRLKSVLHCGIVRPNNMPQVPDVVSGAVGKVSTVGMLGMLSV